MMNARRWVLMGCWLVISACNIHTPPKNKTLSEAPTWVWGPKQEAPLEQEFNEEYTEQNVEPGLSVFYNCPTCQREVLIPHGFPLENSFYLRKLETSAKNKCPGCNTRMERNDLRGFCFGRPCQYSFRGLPQGDFFSSEVKPYESDVVKVLNGFRCYKGQENLQKWKLLRITVDDVEEELGNNLPNEEDLVDAIIIVEKKQGCCCTIL